jgi:hypothetical protein
MCRQPGRHTIQHTGRQAERRTGTQQTHRQAGRWTGRKENIKACRKTPERQTKRVIIRQADIKASMETNMKNRYYVYSQTRSQTCRQTEGR